ncbi:MAG: MerR family transcriptional regulator [Bacteroidetes bacterium]|nr:MerR family transcriptional regulator [Bacteroidota bacterium]
MYKIGEIAKQAGVTTRTLRYYEQLGLVSPDEITPNGYRYYNDRALDITKRIKNLQHVGLSLDEIKDVIGLYFQQKKELEAKEKTVGYLQLHLEQINSKISLLEKAREEIQEQISLTQELMSKLKSKKNG